MRRIHYSVFVRLLSRCVEVVQEPNAPPVVVEVYKASVEQPITSFLTASDEVDNARRLFDKTSREANEALEEVDNPYKLARSSIVAVVKGNHLPAALKSQRTDTDKLNAIEKLLGILNQHQGQPWADTLRQGDFGIKGEQASQALRAVITASKALTTARLVRAKLAEPMYATYMDFKCVIRDAFGSTSKQYRRVHLRASPTEGKTEPTPEEGFIPGATGEEPPPEGEGNVG